MFNLLKMNQKPTVLPLHNPYLWIVDKKIHKFIRISIFGLEEQF